MELARSYGKVAIVTGAGRGMGKAIASHLAGVGVKVAVCDINAENASIAADEISSSKGEAIGIAVDVSVFSDVERMVAEVADKLGGVDILVNNAGILYPTKFEEITPKEWQRTIDVNLTGAFYCCKAVYPIMKENGFGRIVNISSSAGRSTSDLGGAHYTVSKAGMLGLTRHLAKEGGPEINVNAICPGIIMTEMARTFGTEETLEEIRTHLPLKRLGAPKDVADLVLFLVSDASSYITGETIEIDGGELMI
ncbi:MAG: SDR family oxidoreductase [Deltaproteobacteria bacterium]|nr:SDR family oxidoreductase [Deltaproteobacteria bacterium]